IGATDIVGASGTVEVQASAVLRDRCALLDEGRVDGRAEIERGRPGGEAGRIGGFVSRRQQDGGRPEGTRPGGAVAAAWEGEREDEEGIRVAHGTSFLMSARGAGGHVEIVAARAPRPIGSENERSSIERGGWGDVV